jgi:outer membrane receptor protein involved in Fe transport
LGYRGRFFGRVDANLNLFWNAYDSLTTLTLLPGPPGLIRYHFDNKYSAALYGVEFDTRYAATENLALLGNYTYQIMDGRGPGSVIDTDYLTPPKHKFMLGARYSPTRDLHLASHLYYVDAATSRNPANPFARRPVAPYFRLDLNAEYEFWDDRAALSVGVRNLLDSHHYEGGTLFLNDAEVPRMIYAQLRLRVK